MADRPNSPKAVRTFIEKDDGLCRIFERVEQLSSDPSHDLQHLLRVALWALRVAQPSCDARELVAAALLHDFVTVEKSSKDRTRASELSGAAARTVLLEAGFTAESTERMVDAIRCHSYSRGELPSSDLARALVDADRLDVLGAIGVMRTVTTGARMGARYYEPSDPFARNRPLDDRKQTLDHFWVKLLALESTLSTPIAQQEARRRVQFMRAFLAQLESEIAE